MNSLRSISVTRALAFLARARRCQFLVAGEVESAIVIMAPEAFLPVVALHADAKCRELLGQPLRGVGFRQDPDAMLGVYASVEPLTGDEDSVLRIAFFAQSAKQIFGIDDDVSIECAPVFAAYRNGLMEHVQKGGPTSWPLARVSQR
jgi:hypothetical protein